MTEIKMTSTQFWEIILMKPVYDAAATLGLNTGEVTNVHSTP